MITAWPQEWDGVREENRGGGKGVKGFFSLIILWELRVFGMQHVAGVLVSVSLADINMSH